MKTISNVKTINKSNDSYLTVTKHVYDIYLLVKG